MKNELEILRDRLRIKGLDKRLKADLLQCDDSQEHSDSDYKYHDIQIDTGKEVIYV